MGKATYNFDFKRRLIGTEPLDSRVQELLDFAAAKIAPALGRNIDDIVFDISVERRVFDEKSDCMKIVGKWNVLYGKNLSPFKKLSEPTGRWDHYGHVSVSPLVPFRDDHISVLAEEWTISPDGHAMSVYEWTEHRIANDMRLTSKKGVSSDKKDKADRRCRDFVSLFNKVLLDHIIASDKLAIGDGGFDYGLLTKEVETMWSAEKATNVLCDIEDLIGKSGLVKDPFHN